MIRIMGFNCVRLTWPLFLATDKSVASRTVRKSFDGLGLGDAIAGIQANNRYLLDLPLIQAYVAVVENLAANDVMVILDNHISTPGWCCGHGEGNGFFWDEFFDPDLWIQGLTNMATLFKGHRNVVGMSLRNELRGERQNVDDWYMYMQMGAEAVHAANGDVLVILSGLNFDSDLSFLADRDVSVGFASANKLVFEVHWYGFTDGSEWADGNANDVCGHVIGRVNQQAGFLLDRNFPLILSEFGLDLRGTNTNDNRYFSCALAYAAAQDMDWALWALTGSYYLRSGIADHDEMYGLMSFDWSSVKSQPQLTRLQSIQPPFRGPNSTLPGHLTILHPLTGLCVSADDSSQRLVLSDVGRCADRWSYPGHRTLSLNNGSSSSCATAGGVGKEVRLAECETSSTWTLLSDSQLHVSTQMEDGTSLCLEVGGDGRTVVTNPCRCLSSDSSCDPQGQWFVLVNTDQST
ncbi:glycosyl hydrolase 5 family protein-like [Curcuma longa]|uniref:glycosyl hydrolase 5 family protein-like n=1 Tax=Curcuma longa TaxID=136217 RepID=UPI003D9F992B